MALLSSPLVRMRRLSSPRLERVSPFIKGNLLAEAKTLNRAGYSSGAVVIPRMGIERRLQELMDATPKLLRLKSKPGLGLATMMLLSARVVQKHEAELIDKFGRIANKIVHGAKTTKLQARELIRRAAKVLSMLEKRGGAV